MSKDVIKERTKTSVRLDQDVVEIIAEYAKRYTGDDKTKAINEIIRATQKPPIATQVDQRVERLEQVVFDIQQQLTELSKLLIVPATQEPPIATLVLSIAHLADRLAQKHIELSTAKTDRGRVNTLRDLPATLAKIKAANIPQWTADRDPEGLTWQPTDETRKTWVVSQH